MERWEVALVAVGGVAGVWGTAEGSYDLIRKAWDAGAGGIWGQTVGARAVWHREE